MTDNLSLPPEPADEPRAASNPTSEPGQDMPEQGESDLIPLPTAPCWRCRKRVPLGARQCPFCRALLDRDVTVPLGGSSGEPLAPPVKNLLAFMAMLLISLIYGWTIQFGFRTQSNRQSVNASSWYASLVFVEVVDTLLVVATACWMGFPPRLAPVASRRRLLAWLLSLPALIFLLAINYGYHWWLKHSLSLPVVEEDFKLQHGFALLALLAICVQPAVVEEFFFRYLSLGCLKPLTRASTAVIISAVMFGMAHIFAPLSIPLLILVGIVLGYLRLASGGLLLPILVHFGHNAFITFAPRFLP